MLSSLSIQDLCTIDLSGVNYPLCWLQKDKVFADSRASLSQLVVSQMTNHLKVILHDESVSVTKPQNVAALNTVWLAGMSSPNSYGDGKTVRATMQRPTQKSNMRTMIPVRALPERQQKEADHQTHPLLQWHKLTLAGPNSVNREASPTGGGTPKQASQVPHHTATLVRPE